MFQPFALAAGSREPLMIGAVLSIFTAGELTVALFRALSIAVTVELSPTPSTVNCSGPAGLAVAIPAVLAYNAFVRSNRVVLAQLDSFAHDLYAFLTTGSHVNDVASVLPLRTPPLVVRGAS